VFDAIRPTRAEQLPAETYVVGSSSLHRKGDVRTYTRLPDPRRMVSAVIFEEVVRVGPPGLGLGEGIGPSRPGAGSGISSLGGR